MTECVCCLILTQHQIVYTLLLYFAIVEYALGINNHEFNDDEVTTMEEAAQDRAIQFDAYQKGLTTINPYDKDQINNFNANKKIVKLKK